MIHTSDDPEVGQPLCPDCYDYTGHVLFNWHAPELWRRFTIALRRAVRAHLRRIGADPAALRVSFVKVAEYQRRAVVHYHALIRLDPTDNETAPPANPNLRFRQSNSPRSCAKPPSGCIWRPRIGC